MKPATCRLFLLRDSLYQKLKPDEIKNDYVKTTGKVIVEAFVNIDPMTIPAVLV